MNLRELLHQMSYIVEDKVTGYKDDFYNYDIGSLSRLKDCEAAIWLVRECGTFFVKCTLKNEETLDSLFQVWSFKGMYLVTNVDNHFGLSELRSEEETKETLRRLSFLL